MILQSKMHEKSAGTGWTQTVKQEPPEVNNKQASKQFL